ncbi:hypothetical protein DPMN_070565 [Dreissena polymorpha]|uniref:Uncharacterized protein n=1 Tax=Dreissena polymorpha TaxID=45954 RepID=A0A9D3Z5J2_DREPO|nr:hypothetical protein DPMN_070565 [Dreissena polymorpha]
MAHREQTANGNSADNENLTKMFMKNEFNDEQMIEKEEQGHDDCNALQKGLPETGNAVETETDVGFPLQRNYSSKTKARNRTLHVHKILHTICVYSSFFSIVGLAQWSTRPCVS